MTTQSLFNEDDFPVEGFAEFWEHYPRHEAKKDAEKAWKVLKPSPQLRRRIIESIELHKRGVKWNAGFICLPGTFIRGKRWEDDVEMPQVSHKAQHHAFDCPHATPCRRPSECVGRSKAERLGIPYEGDV